ncbi:MAG: beta-carotene hydroxylase, partial [Chitinophagaceae bacterium]
LHEDHHRGGYHPFQKNDAFFLIFALPSMSCLIIGPTMKIGWVTAIGTGILLYGFCYFLVHDVIIHQRFKWFRNTNSTYIRAIRRAHKMHHKHLSKENGESFGLLIIAKKYWNY